MMKTITRFCILAGILLGFSACASEGMQYKDFHGIYADSPHGKEGLYNPERGFRLEVALDVANKNYLWDAKNYPDITSYLEEQSALYATDSVSLVQTYFYLTDLVGEKISPENFQTMAIFFEKLRELGKKAVLRFAYETAFMGRAPKGPTKEDILRHAEQLKPFLEANRDVIQVVQAGMIGAWGEWHSSVHGLEQSDETKREILEAILQMTPEGRYVQVRVPTYKNLLAADSGKYRHISFHDDFIVIQPHPWDGEMSEGTPAFEQIVRESPFLPVDGELPWGTWSVNQDPDNPGKGWLIDGPQTARRLFLQHYTSLSAIHNYKEKGVSDKYSMMQWKKTPISKDFLTKNKMPISDGYFENQDGSAAERNAFDYIRDHLGYRIELQELSCPKRWKAGKENPIELTLINRGFSTLFNDHEVHFVLIDETGKVAKILPTSTRVNDWQPYAPGDSTCTPLLHRIQATWALPPDMKPGTYRLGLWIPDGSMRLNMNPRFAIRCANGNVDWWISKDGKFGVNILTTVEI